MTLDELERLSKAASPAPWGWSSVGLSGVVPFSDNNAAFECKRNDSEFIATARNHIDALLEIARAADKLAKECADYRLGTLERFCPDAAPVVRLLAKLEGK